MQGYMTIIPADSSKEFITTEYWDNKPTLKAMQEGVGGLIETIPYFTGFTGGNPKAVYINAIAYCNEEGLIHNLPINTSATELWAYQVDAAYPLHGDVIVLYGDDEFMEDL